MSNEDIIKNYNLCLDWVKANVNKIGHNPLCIGFGDEDYNHPWLRDEFSNRECSLQLKNGTVLIETLGDFYVQKYGYTKEHIDNTRASYKGTGMRYIDNEHEFNDIGITRMEQFLLEWSTIKGTILDRINTVATLDNNFEV